MQESEVETLTVLLLDGRPVRTGAAIYTLNIGLDGEYEDTKADRRKERVRAKDKLLIRPITLWMREIAMRVYHLNCGTMYAFGFPLKDNTGGGYRSKRPKPLSPRSSWVCNPVIHKRRPNGWRE